MGSNLVQRVCMYTCVQHASDFHSMSDRGGKYTGTGTKADLDNHANQCNPNHSQYRDHTSGYSGTGTKADLDNHANQLNPNNERYQPKRGKWRSWTVIMTEVGMHIKYTCML